MPSSATVAWRHKAPPSSDTTSAGASAPGRAGHGRDVRAAGNLAVQRLRRAHLTVGAADAPAEREADGVARAIVGDAPVRRMCAECEAEEQLAPEIVARTLRGAGRQLPPPIRRDMEMAFGRDFGGVRIHTGAEAARSADAINARAYAHGKDVVLGGVVPALESREGRKVLAHELTHVVQQSGTRAPVRRDFLDDASATLSGAVESVTGVVSEAGGAVVEGVSEAVGAVTSGLPDLATLVGIPEPSDGSPDSLRIILAVAENPVVATVAGAVLPPGTVPVLRGTLDVLDVAWEVLEHPEPYIEEIRAGLGDMIAGAGPLAAKTAAAAVPSTDTKDGVFECIWRHLEPKIAYVAANWWEVLKGMAWDFLWPWPGVIDDFVNAWAQIKAGASYLWNFELSAANDALLAVLRYVNAALGRLYGWFFLASVLIGGIGGGIAGAGAGGIGAAPGALAGAAAGLELAGAVGLGLMVSTLVIEGASIVKAGMNLARSGRSTAQRECDCEIIASSSLTVGITGAMALLGGLAAWFGKRIVQGIFNRVWRRPILRGRGRRSRGDVLADRLALSELTKARFNQRRVTVTDSLGRAENFRGLDLTVDSNIQIRSQRTGATLDGASAIQTALNNGETLRIEVSGGNVMQVKSHAPSARIVQTIQREIGDIANFNSGSYSGHTVVVTNPGQRTLVVFLREALSTADEAAVRATATEQSVALELIVGGTPSSHPAVVALESMPGIVAEIGAEAGREISEGTEDASSAPAMSCP
jgi:hypothetical protein